MITFALKLQLVVVTIFGLVLCLVFSIPENKRSNLLDKLTIFVCIISWGILHIFAFGKIFLIVIDIVENL